MISVLSPRCTCVFWSTVIMSPCTSVILPRTRVGACAATALAARARTSATLLRRIDAIFAYRDALGHELAVVAHARAGEDVRAGLEVVACPGPEGVVLGLGVHQDLLDRKSTRLNSSHVSISYAVFCLKK